MKENEHKYWCDGCDEPFILKGIVKKCPECGSNRIGIDEPIIRTPKK